MFAFTKKVGFSGNKGCTRYNPESLEALKHFLKIETTAYVAWGFWTI